MGSNPSGAIRYVLSALETSFSPSFLPIHVRCASKARAEVPAMGWYRSATMPFATAVLASILARTVPFSSTIISLVELDPSSTAARMILRQFASQATLAHVRDDTSCASSTTPERPCLDRRYRRESRSQQIGQCGSGLSFSNRGRPGSIGAFPLWTTSS